MKISTEDLLKCMQALGQEQGEISLPENYSRGEFLNRMLIAVEEKNAAEPVPLCKNYFSLDEVGRMNVRLGSFLSVQSKDCRIWELECPSLRAFNTNDQESMKHCNAMLHEEGIHIDPEKFQEYATTDKEIVLFVDFLSSEEYNKRGHFSCAAYSRLYDALVEAY